MEKNKTAWIVIEEYDPYVYEHSPSYTIIAVFGTKEEANSYVKELADAEAKEYDVTPTIEYREDDVGYEVLGSYYFVKEMPIW